MRASILFQDPNNHFMKIKVIVIVAALQKDSLSSRLANLCAKISRNDMQIEVYGVGNVPLFNSDLFKGKFPEMVEFIRKKAHQADGVLFVTAQFLGKVSPALKNIYDWLSYSPDKNHPTPMSNMSTALLSTGMSDGQSIHKHFYKMSLFCRSKVLENPAMHFTPYQIESDKCENASIDDKLKDFLVRFTNFINKTRK